MFVLVVDGSITQTRREIPDRLADLPWVVLLEDPRPADTATTTWVRNEPAVVEDAPRVTWTARDLTAEEIHAAQDAAVAQALTADATADNPRLLSAITDLATLLGDSTVAGSIRAWKQPITNNATLTGAQGKALADLLLAALQAQRRVARATLRLAKLQTHDLDDLDVGPE